MTVSIFSLFKVGIGPSSSHTVGPMVASEMFISQLKEKGFFEQTDSISVDLYGSLALTGIGHGTDKALVLGLLGEKPDLVDPDSIGLKFDSVMTSSVLKLNGERPIQFSPKDNIIYLRRKTLPFHPNGICFKALTSEGKILLETIYYSVGGGQIVVEGQENADQSDPAHSSPYDFSSGQELLQLCEHHKLSIPEIVLKNECFLNPKNKVLSYLDFIWEEMNRSIDRGCSREGLLPGSLKVRRRAHTVYQSLTSKPEQTLNDPLSALDWVNLYALAVNEENASGSRVVTAPTNGASGVIPAVIRYYERFIPDSSQNGIRNFLLAATAIGSLYAKNASISGAEVGCQGEVGVACSMAAAGLVAARNGNHHQIEQAAEIAMEHNLGLTCDPIGGLVQIPCIERNAMGAVKAINAARIALKGNGEHFVSLDSVIKTMKETGKDMKSKYKETSRGGLAVNVPLC